MPPQSRFTKFLGLFFGIGLPILFIAASLVLYLMAQNQVKPAHKFLYVTGYRNHQVLVRDGYATLPACNPVNDVERCVWVDNLNFAIYDPATDTSQTITHDKLPTIQVMPNAESPDGYKVVQKTSDTEDIGYINLFGGGNRYNSSIVMVNEKTRSMTAVFTENYYDFYFLGWLQ